MLDERTREIDVETGAADEGLARFASPDLLRHMVLDLRQMKSFIDAPLVMARAEGIWYWDVNGKRYLDGISGIFTVNVGHANPRVLAALHQQIDQICFAPPLHATNIPAVQLANLVAEVAPGDINTVKLLSGGSEATEAAMKLARQYHRQSGNPLKYKVVSLYKGFHGATLGALSATGLSRRKAIFEPTLSGFVKAMPPTCHACPFNLSYPSCGVTCVDQIERIIELEGPETVAAVILEPISNTGGITTPPVEYLPRLREICDRHNVLLIFDEIITGFGRTGQMFAAQTFGVTPDIICMGKGMGSGYGPLAAIAFRDHVAAAFWGDDEDNVEFAHGHTFGGNPLSSAAGLASIREILDRDLCANAREIGDHLRARIQELAPLNVITDVRGKGLLIGMGLKKDAAAGVPFPAELRFGQRVGHRAIGRGLIVRADPDWIALAPPLTITRAEADELFDLFAECLGDELAVSR
ncbi:MAG: adenosylmethionine-8-amino-7-oxononanoate aminotransferase [Chloroflexi bacterium]|nr:adenosylmethionine-8-amino-7-oxononanoate aminotransferase [Chloroflexota bacterium]